jgi:hypothetical protein
MVSYETVRRWVNHFGPMVAADLGKRRPKPHSTCWCGRPRRHRCAKMRSLQISNKGDRPWNLLAELAWIQVAKSFFAGYLAVARRETIGLLVIGFKRFDMIVHGEVRSGRSLILSRRRLRANSDRRRVSQFQICSPFFL